MMLGISSRVSGIKYRLAGLSLKQARQAVQKLESALRRNDIGVKSIQLSHKKLLGSPQLSEKMSTYHNVMLNERVTLQREVGIKQKELQKSMHLEERWRLLHAETRGRESAVRGAIQSEDLIESRIIRTTPGIENLTQVAHLPISFHVDAESNHRQDSRAKVTKETAEEANLPVITELVEGRVHARVQKEGDSLQITLITQSLRDQQVLSHFRRKYSRIAQEQGSRGALIRVERRWR